MNFSYYPIPQNIGLHRINNLNFISDIIKLVIIGAIGNLRNHQLTKTQQAFGMKQFLIKQIYSNH